MQRLLLQIMLPVVLLLPLTSARAQSEDVSTIHWAYSTYFGTGWYQVGDERDAFSIRWAPRRTLQKPSLDEGEKRQWGTELRVPITLGLSHFPLDDVRGSFNPKNFANISVTPGVYVDVPISDRWTLRPFVAAGWGTLLNGDESAWSYWAGLRSRFAFHAGRWDGALLNSIGFVGYSPSTGPSSNFWPITTAVEMAMPLGKLKHDNKQLLVHPHVAYTYFQADLDIIRRDFSSEPISDQWEIALAVSKKDAPITIWKFSFDRLGLAYRFSSDGELQGIGLVFSSLFDE